eukprot:COSAG05_NODE_929_length_6558_cov_3.005264_5_plen_86_part_00
MFGAVAPPPTVDGAPVVPLRGAAASLQVQPRILKVPEARAAPSGPSVGAAVVVPPVGAPRKPLPEPHKRPGGNEACQRLPIPPHS